MKATNAKSKALAAGIMSLVNSGMDITPGSVGRHLFGNKAAPTGVNKKQKKTKNKQRKKSRKRNR